MKPQVVEVLPNGLTRVKALDDSRYQPQNAAKSTRSVEMAPAAVLMDLDHGDVNRETATDVATFNEFTKRWGWVFAKFGNAGPALKET